MKEMIVYFDLKDLEKLQDFLGFINNWQYRRYESCNKYEFGKIDDQDLTIRFYSQPERLNPEASKLVLHPIPDEVKEMFGRCDSLTSTNK